MCRCWQHPAICVANQAKPIFQEQTALNPGKGTVFVAEDEEAVRKLIIRVLEKNGFTVIAAKDGLEAILLINQFANEIQLAILDVVMPLKNGKEVAEYLQSKNPEIPLILMSGYDFNLLESIINSQERKTILHKPFNPLDLVKLVQERIWLRD